MTGSATRRSVLLACAAGLTGCGRVEVASRPPTSANESGSPSKRPSAGKPALSPLLLAIPTLGLSTPLIGLGLNKDGTVEVPSDADRAGWFRLGTVPGERGSAVILGHVDSLTGPAVFADLATMRRADRVKVSMSDDSVVTFEVDRVVTYANADFPADLVYAGHRRVPELNLVTCGGVYDRDRGGYQSNVVVFTRRTATYPK